MERGEFTLSIVDPVSAARGGRGVGEIKWIPLAMHVYIFTRAALQICDC